MPTTPNLSLPYLEAGQAQKHVTLNESLRRLDAVTQLAVTAVSGAPPAEPDDGERHIVDASPTGAFAGHANEVAAFQDGAWVFLAPQPGWRAWNVDAETLLVWTGEEWSEVGGGESGEGDVVGPDGGVADGDLALFDGATGKAVRKGRGAIDYLGVGAPPDATDTDTSNRLVVKASRALFYAREDAETPGTGDIKLQISKEAEGNSASFFFSTNFSGRAEFGLVESDGFKLKVSPDGSEWIEALSFDPATGAATFREIADVRRRLSGNLTLYVNSATGSDGNDGTPGSPFATIQKAIDTAAALDLGVHDVAIQVADGAYAPVVLRRMTGSGVVTIAGNTAAPANVHLTSAAGQARIVAAERCGRYVLRGMKFSATGAATTYLVFASGGDTDLRVGNIEFGQASNHIYAELNANVQSLTGADGNCTISAGGARQMYAIWGGHITTASSATITVSGTPHFSAAFAEADQMGRVSGFGGYSGAATGKRYQATFNGVIRALGGSATHFPGNADGSAAAGGQYG